jgi:hypothetical protein
MSDLVQLVIVIAPQALVPAVIAASLYLVFAWGSR